MFIKKYNKHKLVNARKFLKGINELRQKLLGFLTLT